MKRIAEDGLTISKQEHKTDDPLASNDTSYAKENKSPGRSPALMLMRCFRTSAELLSRMGTCDFRKASALTTFPQLTPERSKERERESACNEVGSLSPLLAMKL